MIESEFSDRMWGYVVDENKRRSERVFTESEIRDAITAAAYLHPTGNVHGDVVSVMPVSEFCAWLGIEVES